MLRSSELPAYQSKRWTNLIGSNFFRRCIKSDFVMCVNKRCLIPKYIKMVHWLYEQNRMVTLTEVAKFMNVTLSGVHHYIKSVRKFDNIFQVRISQIDIANRKQYAIRVLAIKPYRLVSGRPPVLADDSQYDFEKSTLSMSDIWRELVGKSWDKISLFV